MAPTAVENVFEGQRVQFTAVDEFEYEPSFLKVPGGQGRHAEEPGRENGVALGQATHVTDEVAAMTVE